MKKWILGIILILSSHIVFGMEKKIVKEAKTVFEREIHHPMLQADIEEGIKSELRNGFDSAEGVINAFRYIDDLTSTDEDGYLNKKELINKVKDLAKTELAPEYADLTKEELNNKFYNRLIPILKNAKKCNLFESIRQKMTADEGRFRDYFVKLIIAGANPNLEIMEAIDAIPANESLLQLMIDLEDINFVLLLILYGADVNHKNSLGDRPLNLAVHGYCYHPKIQKKQVVKLLIKHGADVNARDGNRRNTAVILAFRTQQEILLKLLLKNGAKFNEGELNAIKEAKPQYHPEIYEKFVEILKKYNYEI